MSALQIITRGRTPARSAHAAELLLVACLAAASGGCQWILDDIDATAHEAGTSDAGDDAGDEEESTLADGAPRPAKDGGTVENPPGTGGRDAATPDGSAGSSTDAAPGAGTDAGMRDAGMPLDGADPAADVSVSCTEPVLWYPDDDQDHYGRSSSPVRACPAPAGRWALVSGDCNDDDPDVHPEQREFFEISYPTADGSESFDYDCSGAEEGNGTQAAFAGSCGLLLNLAVCEGGSRGYQATTRPDAQNGLCGSRETITCQPPALLGALLCVMTIETMAEPYLCR
jgi:hypothetical protein